MGVSGVQSFGGDWTEQKLAAIREYLGMYVTALKNQPFRKIYIDGFAGTGYREMSTAESAGDERQLWEAGVFPEMEQFREGSAAIALQTDPAFDEMYFIERSPRRRQELQSTIKQFAHPRVNVFDGDANDRIMELCARTNWRSTRGVVFLDPFGMAVDWRTVEAIARTKALDLWYLFPSGVAIARMLPRDVTKIPTGWRDRLTRCLGTSDWEQEFYKASEQVSLFPDVPRIEKYDGVNADVVADYFRQRLSSVFAFVADKPGALVTSDGRTLYHLFFAVGNRNGVRLARKLSKQAMKDLSNGSRL
jgi:three-Cys-motif partner protein